MKSFLPCLLLILLLALLQLWYTSSLLRFLEEQMPSMPTTAPLVRGA